MAKVLVLEDDALSHKVVERVLANFGHQIVASRSTQEAWDKLQEHVLVDMVVLDNQLGNEWGWQFLRMVRQSPAYRGLPVIVYTAHTERSSIIRYVELGVQSLHMKPYQGDVLMQEIKKAVESKWTAQVMEPAETLCERLKLSVPDYNGLLALASRTIEESLLTAKKRLTNPNDPHLFAALSNIEQRCRSVGIFVAEGVVSSIRGHIQNGDVVAAVEGLRGIESFLHMIRHRMLAMMNMEDSVARNTETKTAVAKPVAVVPVPAASDAATYVRDIISKPLWQYGPQLRRILKSPLLTEEQRRTGMMRIAITPPFSTVSANLRLLDDLPKLSLQDAARIVRETRGFTANFKAVLDHVTGTTHALDSESAMLRVIGHHGIAKVVVMATAARVVNGLPRDSMLNLRPLFLHSLTVALLAFEVGRLLKLANEHLLAAGGLAHDAGRWFFAIGEPGAYALALAVSEDGDAQLADVERLFFGVDHYAAGPEMLQAMAVSAFPKAAAAAHHNPALVTDQEHVIGVSVVHVAHVIVQAGMATSETLGKSILAPLRESNYIAWEELKRSGVALPFEASEMVDTLIAIAKTSRWTVEQLLGERS